MFGISSEHSSCDSSTNSHKEEPLQLSYSVARVMHRCVSNKEVGIEGSSWKYAFYSTNNSKYIPHSINMCPSFLYKQLSGDGEGKSVMSSDIVDRKIYR